MKLSFFDSFVYHEGMGNLIEQKLRQHPSPIISEGELACLLGGTPHSRYARCKRAVQKGELNRVKRGLYIINKQLSLRLPSAYQLAQRIYGPSYISLESALSYHNLIPEAVYTVTSATTQRSKTVIAPWKIFSYTNFPTPNFFVSVAAVHEGDAYFLLASPWKALFDFIYHYKKDYDSLFDAEGDLRLNLYELPKINAHELNALQRYYQSERITKFINTLPSEYRHHA